MQFRYTLEQICALVGEGAVEGVTADQVSALATLQEARPGDLSFLGNLKYKNQVAETKASIVLLPKDFQGTPREGQAFLRVENPSLALARVCREIERLLWPLPVPGIHPTAVVDPQAQVDAAATIGPGCVVGAHAVIGAGTHLVAQVHVGRHVRVGQACWLAPHVSILDYCEIGNRVRIHSNTVIGSDGFGYEATATGIEKVPQIGKVVLGEDVEIGSCTTIDRARFGVTAIGQGTKIDNLVQIAHNVQVGRCCIIVSQVGISGSTVIEDGVVIAGQAGLTGHLRIGKGSKIGAQTGLNHDLPPDSYVRGTPAYPYMAAHKIDILKGKLPGLFKRVSKIEDVMAQLSASTGHEA